MGKLIYSRTTSPDSFVVNGNGDIEWTIPSEEVHAFVNDLFHNVGMLLFGRKMYETMKEWDAISTEGTSRLMDGRC